MDIVNPFLPGLARCPALGRQFRCLCSHLWSFGPGGGLGEQVLWWRCWKSAGDCFFLKRTAVDDMEFMNLYEFVA